MADRVRRPDDFLEHGCATDFFAQRQILVVDLLFSPLAVVDIGTGGVPSHDASVTVDERLVLDEKPSVLPVLETRPHFQFERDTTLHPLRAVASELLKIVGMKQPFAKAIGHHFIQAEARRFENRCVRIEDLAGGTHRDDELRNRIDDLPKLLLIASQGGFVARVCDR